MAPRDRAGPCEASGAGGAGDAGDVLEHCVCLPPRHTRHLPALPAAALRPRAGVAKRAGPLILSSRVGVGVAPGGFA